MLILVPKVVGSSKSGDGDENARKYAEDCRQLDAINRYRVGPLTALFFLPAYLVLNQPIL